MGVETIMKEKIATILIAAAILLFLITFCELTSIGLRYKLEEAIILKVVPDAKGLGGFIGEDVRTLVRFKDGLTSHLGGDRGDPGEIILAPRTDGTISMFGLAGDTGLFFNRKP